MWRSGSPPGEQEPWLSPQALAWRPRSNRSRRWPPWVKSSLTSSNQNMKDASLTWCWVRWPWARGWEWVDRDWDSEWVRRSWVQGQWARGWQDRTWWMEVSWSWKKHLRNLYTGFIPAAASHIYTSSKNLPRLFFWKWGFHPSLSLLYNLCLFVWYFVYDPSRPERKSA